MPDDEPFERFIQCALGHASKLDPAAAHGFLTAAALCPGGYEDRLWQSGLFGGEQERLRTDMTGSISNTCA